MLSLIPHRRIKVISLFLLSYLIFLLATLPANQILPRLRLPDGIRINDIYGSLWQGEIGELHWQSLSLHHVRWNVQFRRLWQAMPTVEVSIHDPDMLEADATIGWRGIWQIDDFRLNLPATSLQQHLLHPLIRPFPAQIGGTIQVKAKQLRFDTNQCLTLSDANAEWQQASLLTPAGALQLDAVHASLRCPQHDSLEIKADQQSAALQSQLTLHLLLTGQYQLQATLTPGDELPNDLRSSLEWFGSKDNLGRIRIKNNGSWY